MKQWQILKKLLTNSFRDLIPVALVVLFFQLIVLQTTPDDWQSILIGFVIVGIGLAVFLQGLEIGIFPIGESLANQFSKSHSTFLLLIFSFLVGYGTTRAEPALALIASKANLISEGKINEFWLREVVAISVGFAISLGVLRIIIGYPIHYLIISGYFLVIAVTYIAPPEIVALAYDLGGVTTSTVTVPLVAALGIGLASSIKGRNPIIDSFGLIALASLMPMIFVQLYGAMVYSDPGGRIANLPEFSFIQPALIDAIAQFNPIDLSFVIEAAGTINFFNWNIQAFLDGFLAVIQDVTPILAIILFFHYAILRKPVPEIKKAMLGFIFVIIGLYAFLIGLEMGLFSLGEELTRDLVIHTNNYWVIYGFGFAIGFATTMAEPALIAIAQKAKEISSGKIDNFTLRIFVAIGVAIGIALGCYRIVVGDDIHQYIIIGYTIVVILTFFAPRYIIAIAYDSGGVTTSTVTVPLVAALGLSLATSIDGRSPLIDGFGLVAFASLFPIITVMGYGLVAEWINRPENLLIPQGANIVQRIFHPHPKAIKSKSGYSIIHTIISDDRADDAILAAKEGGALGVTIMPVESYGLKEVKNFYRTPVQESKLLIFVVPDDIATEVVDHLNQNIHFNSNNEHGIAYVVSSNQVTGFRS